MLPPNAENESTVSVEIAPSCCRVFDADAMSSPNEARLFRVVLQRVAYLRDEAGEIRVHHERVRPQSLLQLEFRHDA